MKSIDAWCYFPIHPANNILDKYEEEFKLDPDKRGLRLYDLQF